MQRYIVERNLPGASNLSPEERQNLAKVYLEARDELGKPFFWVSSFVIEDKLYCILVTDSPETIREHSRLSKFPIHNISEIKTILDPLSSNPFPQKEPRQVSACHNM